MSLYLEIKMKRSLLLGFLGLSLLAMVVRAEEEDDDGINHLTGRMNRCIPERLEYFHSSIEFHRKLTLELSPDSCKDEFTSHNTCCNSENLRDYMKKVIEAEGLRWNNALRAVHKFKEEVLTFREEIKRKAEEFEKSMETAVKTNLKLKEPYQAARFLKNLYSFYREKVYDEREAQFKASAQICFDNLESIRKATMCLLCSDRNPLFYNVTHFNIKQTTCDTALRDCLPSFRFMLPMMGSYKALAVLLNYAKGKPKHKIFPGDMLFEGSLFSSRYLNFSFGRTQVPRGDDPRTECRSLRRLSNYRQRQ